MLPVYGVRSTLYKGIAMKKKAMELQQRLNGLQGRLSYLRSGNVLCDCNAGAGCYIRWS